MYISKLSLHGFKSFHNKTNLTIGQGITAVVGPCGWGKSNIVDAPLDDSNINKFTKVFRNFSGSTQFILVTHYKITFKKADYMYGIK